MPSASWIPASFASGVVLRRTLRIWPLSCSATIVTLCWVLMMRSSSSHRTDVQIRFQGLEGLFDSADDVVVCPDVHLVVFVQRGLEQVLAVHLARRFISLGIPPV